MSEKDTQNRILRLSHGDTRLFRNNIGQAYQGKATRLRDGSVMIRNPQVVKYGVGGPGGSDTIGWQSVIVTPDMVGQRVAIFSAVEVKHGRGKPTELQIAFIDTVLRHGGRAGIAYSEDEAKEILHGDR